MERIETFVNWQEDDWNSFFVEKGRRWRSKDYRYLNDIFDLNKLNSSLLDVGCGFGDGLLYLKKNASKLKVGLGRIFLAKQLMPVGIIQSYQI